MPVVKAIGSCASCGYPLSATATGEIQTCPMCGTVNQAIAGVTIPTPVLVAVLSFAAGVILGPNVKRQLGKVR